MAIMVEFVYPKCGRAMSGGADIVEIFLWRNKKELFYAMRDCHMFPSEIYF